MTEIDTEAFLADLYALREIGALQDRRPPPDLLAGGHGSPPLADGQRMAEAGLEPAIDGIGNVHRAPSAAPARICWPAATSRPRTRPAGSTARSASWPALALARAGLPRRRRRLRRRGGPLHGGFLGSRSIIGELTEAEIDRRRNRTDGTPLRDALARGRASPGSRGCSSSPGRHKGFLEMHIEQGTQLEARRPAHRRGHRHRRDLAVAHRRRGQAEPCRRHHHGGAPGRRPRRGAAARRDRPGVPEGLRPRAAPGPPGASRWIPARRSIIPGRAEVFFQFRDVDVPVLERHGGLPARAGAREQPARALPRRRWRPWPRRSPPPATRPDAARARSAAEALAPGALAAHALAAPATTRRYIARRHAGRDAVRPLASAASATTGPRIPATPTWSRASGRSVRRRRGCWRGDSGRGLRDRLSRHRNLRRAGSPRRSNKLRDVADRGAPLRPDGRAAERHPGSENPPDPSDSVAMQETNLHLAPGHGVRARPASGFQISFNLHML